MRVTYRGPVEARDPATGGKIETTSGTYLEFTPGFSTPDPDVAEFLRGLYDVVEVPSGGQVPKPEREEELETVITDVGGGDLHDEVRVLRRPPGRPRKS